MIEYHDVLNGVITDDNGEVVRYISITDNLLEVFLVGFKKLCGKPGYYTFRVNGEGDKFMDYDFWIKPEGDGLKEIPIKLWY